MNSATIHGRTLLVALPLSLALLIDCQNSTLPTEPQPQPYTIEATNPIASGMLNHAADSRPCGYGDARSIFESLEVANEILLFGGPDQPRAHTLIHCQYRFFWEDGHPLLGGPVTFSDQDVFLGGIAFFLSYKSVDLMTRNEAIALLEGIEVRTWLAEVTEHGVGELVEQPLMTSAMKNVMADNFGFDLIVQRHWGFIAQLPAGEYVSVTEVRWPPPFEEEFRWTVQLLITSSNE